MIRSSGIPHNAPKKQIGNAIREREEKRAHKSPQSAQKAKEVKGPGARKLTREEAIQWYESRRG